MEVAKEIPDLDEVLEKANLEIPAALAHVIMKREAGPRLAYYLAKNPEECQRIADMDHEDAVLELGLIEASFGNSSPQPKPRVSRAPAPISPVRSTGSTSIHKDPSEMSQREYEKWRANGGGA